jgi:hypothetical protein
VRRQRLRTICAASICLTALTTTGCANWVTLPGPSDSASSEPAPSQSTAVQEAGESWSGFSEQWLLPLVPALSWALGLAVTLIVVARLLVPVKPWSKEKTASRSRRIRFGPWSVLAVFIFSLTTVMVVALTDEGVTRLVLSWAAFSGALVSASWCWWWLGARPRVAIRVTNIDGTASVQKSALLTHFVDELGAASPRGVERPSATDLTQLAEATSKVSENAFITSVIAILEYVGNTAPWQVEVQELGENAALIDIRWNGAAISSERIERASERLPDVKDAPDALEQMAAAVVATAMAKHYVDWTGLYGATRWRSVGFHQVSRGMPANSAAKQKFLLEQAITADEKNALARAAHENVLYGRATQKEKLDDYLMILKQKAEDLARAAHRHPLFDVPVEIAGTRDRSRRREGYPQPTALLIRTLIVWSSTVRNRIALDAAATNELADTNQPSPITPKVNSRPDQSVTTRDQAEVSALWGLVTLVRNAADELGNPRNDLFLIRMRARTAISIHRLHEAGVYGGRLNDLVSDAAPIQRRRLFELVMPGEAAKRISRRAAVRDVSTWFGDARASEDPVIAYTYACHIAMQTSPMPLDEEGHDEFDRELRRKLEVCLGVPGKADWARHDPELFKIQDRYWELLHRDNPISSWDVEPLKDHMAKLAQIGISTAATLAAARPAVGVYLGMDFLEYRRIREVAALAAHLEGKTPEAYSSRVPLFLKKLVGYGIDTVGLLRSADQRELLVALDDAARGLRNTSDSRYLDADEAVAIFRKAWS